VPWISGSILVLVLLCAVFASFVAPHDPRAIALGDARQPPLSPGHFLGTDLLGRDMLSRLIYGARDALVVSVLAISAAVGVGSVLGLVAGFVGGIVDRIIMRITDAVLAFPAILIAMLIVVILGQGFQNVLLAVVFTTWPRFARMLRGEVLKLRELEFVVFARVAGTPTHRILLRHIFPNVAPVLLVVATLMTAEVILLAASLSFLGLGYAPGDPAWGLMVSEGRAVLRQTWWLALFPGLAITVVVIAVNFVGDWLSERWDPQRRAIVPSTQLSSE
jgi:peptide/nickel transport system permease protein